VRHDIVTLQIAIIHSPAIASGEFDDFANVVAAPNLSLRIDSRDHDGPYAGLEWLVPTAVAVYLGKSYFDAFLKEMGKDHYQLLKKGLKTFRTKFVGPNAPQVTIISSSGKVNTSQQYSLVFSVLAEAESGRRFKLLVERDISENEFDEVVDAFLSFLESYHSGTLDTADVEKLKSARAIGGTLLLAFDRATKAIEPKDPTIRKAPE
jgi:hypothetical protein